MHSCSTGFERAGPLACGMLTRLHAPPVQPQPLHRLFLPLLGCPRAWAPPLPLRHWRHSTPQSPSHPTKPCWLRLTAKTTQARPVLGDLQAAEQMLCRAARAAAMLPGTANNWHGSTRLCPGASRLVTKRANQLLPCSAKSAGADQGAAQEGGGSQQGQRAAVDTTAGGAGAVCGSSRRRQQWRSRRQR